MGAFTEPFFSTLQATVPHRLVLLREFVEDPAHYWDPLRDPSFQPAADERYTAEIEIGPATTLRFVYVVIRWHDRLLRKLAISSRRAGAPVLPNPAVTLQLLQDHLGFEP